MPKLVGKHYFIKSKKEKIKARRKELTDFLNTLLR